MISVLVVNLNNLQFTKNCINDLMMQDIEFDLTLVDQNSKESGTDEFLSEIQNLLSPVKSITIIRNQFNKSLNSIWNEFVEDSNNEFICLLNNDVRLCPNFLSSAIEVFQIDPSIGFVNHTTNHENYKTFSNNLEYSIINFPYRQGWDPIFRKSCYNRIPEELQFFYGDDYIYSKLYSSKMRGAYVLNSPIIHYCKQTTDKNGAIRDVNSDKKHFKTLDLEYKIMHFVTDFSKLKPEFDTEEFIKTVSYYNLLKNF